MMLNPEKIPKGLLILSLLMISTLFGLAQQTITVNSLPVVNIVEQTISLPPGQDSIQPTVVTDDPGNYTYQWSGPIGFTSSVIEPWLSVLGTYTLTATNSYGCSSTDQLLLRASNPTDTVWIQYPLPPMCQGEDSIALDFYVNYPGEGIFEGEGIVDRYFYPNTAGTFVLSWIMDDDTINVPITVYGAPDVYIDRDTVFRCQGQSAWLSAVGSADTYSWSYLGDTTVLSTDQYYSVMINSPTTYSLTAGIDYNDKVCYTIDTVSTLPISASFSYEQTVIDTTYGTLYGSYVHFNPDYKLGTSYTWDFGNHYVGGATSSQVSPTYNYNPFNGYFTVTLTMESMCGETTSSQVVRVNYLETVGIEDNIQIEEIELYPNPATDYIYLQFGEDNVSRIQIFNLSGQVVSTELVQGYNHTLNVYSYPQGTYIVKIYGKNGGVLSTKFIKR